jgi:uncharacterized protein (TIGR02722 family)
MTKTSMHTLTRRLRAVLSLAALSAAGCATHVERINPEAQVDLTGRWNDVDSRQVADAMVHQSFAADYGGGWAVQYMQAHGGRRPTVIVGSIRNRSLQHIPVETFVRDIERAYLGSGQVQVVASAEERDEVRDERADQQENAIPESRARMAREHGAQYMLQGDISEIADREGGRAVVYYQVDMTLVDLETNAKTWTGQHRIKKLVEHGRYRL